MAQRIHSIDAVRAVALLGILLVHSHDTFNVYIPDKPTGWLDTFWDGVVAQVLLSKAYMVFSFLFGLSFFLQMDHARERGIDFRARFCWRLFLLLLFGLIHSFFYCGDILIIFAILGIIPVILWRTPTRWVLLMAAICLLHPLALYHSLNNTPHALYEWYQNICPQWGLTGTPSAAQASFLEMGQWNITCGIGHCLLYIIYSHRIWSIIGMFLLGMVAGRTRLFEGNPRRLLLIAAGGSFTYLLLMAIPDGERYTHPLTAWRNVAYVIAFVPALAWLFRQHRFSFLMAPLTPIGRCTLTCYITQSIIMMWCICGYGLNLGFKLSTTGIMGLALGLYLLQLLCCHLWLKRFRYGPLEGLWRRATRVGMKTLSPA